MMIARVARQMLQTVIHGYFHFVALLVTFLFPERLWYRALFQICRVQQYLVRPILGLTFYRKDPRRAIALSWLVESALRHLVLLGRPFPIPVLHKNLELVLNARSNQNGLVLCCVHLPFTRFFLLPLLEAGVPPTAVIAIAGSLKGGGYAVWGTTKEVRGLIADRDVLIKVRTILRQGGFVATAIDLNLGDPLNINVFRLIRSTGARVVFMVSELQSDGAILIEFLPPPDSLCLSDESVISNLLFLQGEADRILQRPPSPNKIANMLTKKGSSETKVAALEVDSSS